MKATSEQAEVETVNPPFPLLVMMLDDDNVDDDEVPFLLVETERDTFLLGESDEDDEVGSVVEDGVDISLVSLDLR